MNLLKSLSWFTRRKHKQREVQTVAFLSEQDETSQNSLKAAFCRLFSKQELVKKAYLTPAQYSGAARPSMTLCLSCIRESDEEKIVGGVCKIVRKKFRKSPSLDILVLTDYQEAEVHKVCKPFYVR